ncbi:MAG: hypothetical protein H9W81_07375 [Enterococcus sp.]|nr:hypothetical protein [Enterococcus sp.]
MTIEAMGKNYTGKTKSSMRDSLIGLFIALIIVMMIAAIASTIVVKSQDTPYEKTLKSMGSDIEQWTIENPYLAGDKLIRGTMLFGDLISSMPNPEVSADSIPEEVLNSTVSYTNATLCVVDEDGSGYKYYDYEGEKLISDTSCPE